MTYKVTINNRIYTTAEHLTILQLCTRLNIQIPKFCYHELLSIAGNCRMCLVQVNNSMKPVASCATNIMDGMIINTNNFFVQKARESVIEFLLINHPLDCPICDQAGECDLQDQTLYFGSDRGRFNEIKRSVVDKNLGPFIKTIMTRCIHCTRCVRFSNEIAGVSFLGTVGRGRDTEISNYVYTIEMNSVLSGNLIDICPVGALTSKPYAFVGRPWELSKTETVDVFDTLGSRIRVDTRGSDILRILPRYTKGINEEWITDKIRFCYDGLKLQRLVVPLSKRFLWHKDCSSFYKNISWDESLKLFKSFYFFSTFLNPFSISHNLECGSVVDYLSLINIKNLVSRVGFSISGLKLDNHLYDFDCSYKFSNSYEMLADSSFYLLVGSNIESELPILNTYIRKSVLEKDSLVYYVGYNASLNYLSNHIGYSLNLLNKVLRGSHFICSYLSSSFKKSVLFNNSILYNSLFASSLGIYSPSCDFFPILSSPFYLQSLNINLNNSIYEHGSLFHHSSDLVLNIGSIRSAFISKRSVFIGTNGHDFSTSYSLLLPCFSFAEMDSAVFNLNGSFSKVRKVVPTPGLTRSVGDILSAFISVMNSSSFTYKSCVDYIEFNNAFNKSSYFVSHFPCLFHINSSNFSDVSHFLVSPLKPYFKDNETVSNSRVLSSRCMSTVSIF
jgi:NADH dehydrogenase (ubiquinone) Fe-S protein 1